MGISVSPATSGPSANVIAIMTSASIISTESTAPAIHLAIELIMYIKRYWKPPVTKSQRLNSSCALRYADLSLMTSWKSASVVRLSFPSYE